MRPSAGAAPLSLVCCDLNAAALMPLEHLRLFSKLATSTHLSPGALGFPEEVGRQRIEELVRKNEDGRVLGEGVEAAVPLHNLHRAAGYDQWLQPAHSSC